MPPRPMQGRDVLTLVQLENAYGVPLPLVVGQDGKKHFVATARIKAVIFREVGTPYLSVSK